MAATFWDCTAEADERRLYESQARQCGAEEERELRLAQYHFGVFQVCAERARGWRDKAQELRKLKDTKG